VSDGETAPRRTLGRLLALIVHDLRNPTATISANADFLGGSEMPDPDSREALEDVALAVDDLKHGLTLVSWIARELCGEPALQKRDGDVVEAVRQALSTRKGTLVDPPPEAVAPGGASIAPIVEVFLDNAARHSRSSAPEVRVENTGDAVVVRVEDQGAPLAETLRDRAFTIDAQDELKGRPDGRYGRFASLVAAGAAAQAIGAELEIGDQDGRNVFVIRLPV